MSPLNMVGAQELEGATVEAFDDGQVWLYLSLMNSSTLHAPPAVGAMHNTCLRLWMVRVCYGHSCLRR